MELFKANKVNPVGGCLPMLITLPFFFGFYRMLSSSAELRFAPFLWAHDLSAPDTVAVIPILGGIPINILPLLLGATMLLQMQLTPQPTVDNSQAKMMKFMPLIFMFVCYGYSCALSLYSTVNAMFTIVQQLVINRMKDAEPVVAAVAKGGKGLKNVTPKRK
jgi:YidC/Oxa1 family membrane protein insertase